MLRFFGAEREFDPFKYSGVVGFSAKLQPKIVAGAIHPNRTGIRIYVEKKRPRWLLWFTLRHSLPKKIHGIETDVVEVGKIKILSADLTPEDRQRRIDPIPAGVSIGEKDITAGTNTLEDLLVDLTDGKAVGATNAHVGNMDAPAGSEIYQPGPYDGGKPKDVYARKKREVPVHFLEDISDCPAAKIWSSIYNGFAWFFRRKTRLRGKARVSPMDAVTNEADICCYEYTGDREVTKGVLKDDGTLHIPERVSRTAEGREIWVCGRTTGYRKGPVIDTDASLNVSYGTGRTGMFIHQVMVDGNILEPGNSGSAGFDGESGDIVGLGFAGSGSVSIFNHVDRAFELLKVELR